MLVISKAGRALRQVMSRRRASAGPCALVLMYHRIAKVQDDPWDLAVSPENFAAHLRVVRGFGPCLGFSAMMDALQGGAPPPCGIAVTFDDGYRDNLEAALPLLEAAGVSATVFVTSGTIGSGREFWWDMLVRLILSTPRLPPRLSKGISGRQHELRMGERGSPQRLRSFNRLRGALLPLPLEQIYFHLDEIAAWAGQDAVGPKETHPMDENELRRLAASPLIEIGGHTRTHAPLTMIPPDLAAREIADGRKELIRMTGHKIDSFAYPFGKHDRDVVRMTAEAGFRHAATVIDGVAAASTTPLRVPRLQVKNWTAEVFESNLRAYVGSPRTVTPFATKVSQ